MENSCVVSAILLGNVFSKTLFGLSEARDGQRAYAFSQSNFSIFLRRIAVALADVSFCYNIFLATEAVKIEKIDSFAKKRYFNSHFAFLIWGNFCDKHR